MCDSRCENYFVTYDKGWGCSYRCVQSVFSVLLKSEPYATQLAPKAQYEDIRDIQRDIQMAWSEHRIDEDGARTFNHSLQNKKDWIGATEVAALLRSFRINAVIYDFFLKKPQTQHNKLIEVAVQYFLPNETIESFVQSRRTATIMNKPPLYFQTDGHSMLIVGLAISASTSAAASSSTNSVPFDISLVLYDSAEKDIFPVLRAVSALNDQLYQIVAIEGLITSDEEFENSKVLMGKVCVSE